MTERQLDEYLEYLKSFGSKPGLDSIKELCKKLGNPQDYLKFIHVAGTNGKGSVCAYLSSVFKEAGMKTGRYTSPAVFDYRERFVINEKPAGKKIFLQYMERVKNVCDEMVSEGLGQPTVFEVETALAFLYFFEKKCDIVVLECGMGGLLDATNIIKTPVMEVIVPISKDHEAFLGNSLEEIARQKAGIIKQGSIAVSAAQPEEVRKVIEQECADKNARLVFINDSDITDVKFGLNKQSFRYRGTRYIINIAGVHQTENAALAVRAVQELFSGKCDLSDTAGADTSNKGFCREDEQKKKKSLQLNQDFISKGLQNASWPGRFTIVSKNPYVILDGAHNEAGAKALADSLKFHFPNRRIIYIMGVFRDKDTEAMIKITASLAGQIITVTLPDKERSMDALELAGEIMKENKNVTAADSIEEACELAFLLVDRESVIVVFGSLSHLKKVRDIVNGRQGKSTGGNKGAASRDR